MIEIYEPFWMKNMVGDSFVSAAEVKNAFGVCADADINRLIFQGAIPDPSERKARNKESPERLLWKVSDLRKVFKKD